MNLAAMPQESRSHRTRPPFSRQPPSNPAVAIVIGLMSAAAAAAKPATHIGLPSGYQPEGIAAGHGHTAYVGSIPTGAVRRLDTRTGKTTPLIPPHEGRAAIGLKLDNAGKRLFVAGGPTGSAFVYSSANGKDVKQIRLAPAGQPTFVNDVAISKKTAYFTDSRRQAIYAIDASL